MECVLSSNWISFALIVFIDIPKSLTSTVSPPSHFQSLKHTIFISRKKKIKTNASCIPSLHFSHHVPPSMSQRLNTHLPPIVNFPFAPCRWCAPAYWNANTSSTHFIVNCDCVHFLIGSIRAVVLRRIHTHTHQKKQISPFVSMEFTREFMKFIYDKLYEWRRPTSSSFEKRHMNFVCEFYFRLFIYATVKLWHTWASERKHTSSFRLYFSCGNFPESSRNTRASSLSPARNG